MLPATLTVSFRELHPIKVTKLQRPGLLRVTNDNSRTVRFLYGDFRRPRPDGRTRVLAHDSVVVRVHRRTIDWVAFFGNFRVLVGIGTVRRIELPTRTTTRSRTGTTFSRVGLKHWSDQR